MSYLFPVTNSSAPLIRSLISLSTGTNFVSVRFHLPDVVRGYAEDAHSMSWCALRFV